MKKYCLIFLCGLVVMGCKEKKKNLTGDEIVTAADFVDFFPELKLPFVIADTSLAGKNPDSLAISSKVLKQFIPDSVTTKDFGKAVNTKFYPIGQIKEKNKEIYLFLKAVNGTNKVAYLCCFDQNKKFIKAMPLIKTDQDKYSSAYGSVDNKFQITTYTEKKQGENISFKRKVYVFNAATGDFTLILTEPNEELIETIINPIDTLSKKHKWTGDYVKDKKNFVSIRDSRKPNELLFFVHFEKDNGDCKGELKGQLSIINTGKAVFKDGGGPCTIDFDFGANTVSMKEIGGCGNYRDIKCFFEGSFRKKPEPKAKPVSKKK